jgi:hypothetical protein
VWNRLGLNDGAHEHVKDADREAKEKLEEEKAKAAKKNGSETS